MVTIERTYNGISAIPLEAHLFEKGHIFLKGPLPITERPSGSNRCRRKPVFVTSFRPLSRRHVTAVGRKRLCCPLLFLFVPP